MPFLIETWIEPAQAGRREQVRPDHLAYLGAEASRLLAAGAKLEDDGRVGPGSFYLLDTELRSEAEAFLAADPYARAGLIASATMTRVRQGFYNRQRHGAETTPR